MRRGRFTIRYRPGHDKRVFMTQGRMSELRRDLNQINRDQKKAGTNYVVKSSWCSCGSDECAGHWSTCHRIKVVSSEEGDRTLKARRPRSKPVEYRYCHHFAHRA